MANLLQGFPFLDVAWQTYLKVRFGPTFLFARQATDASSKKSCVNSLILDCIWERVSILGDFYHFENINFISFT